MYQHSSDHWWHLATLKKMLFVPIYPMFMYHRILELWNERGNENENGSPTFAFAEVFVFSIYKKNTL